MVSGTLGGIGTDDIDRIVADLRLDAAATVERYAPALARIYRVLLERFTEASGALNKRIADPVGPLPAWASERVATAFEIGRAPWRDRVLQYVVIAVVAVPLKKKQ